MVGNFDPGSGEVGGGECWEPADMPHVSTHHPLGTWPVSRQHVFSAHAHHSPQSGLLVGRLTAPVTDRVMEQAGEGAWG